MREVILTKNGAQKINQGCVDLIKGDFDYKYSLVKGEIVKVLNSKNNQSFLGSIEEINQNINIYILSKFSSDFNDLVFIEQNLNKSFLSKKIVFDKNFRLAHGASDNLPGLIIDSYENCNLIQINLAYLDKHRDSIKKIVSELTGQKSFIIDDESMRAKASLPNFESEVLPPEIIINENGINYQVESELIQKNGYYFDHRINRKKALEISDLYLNNYNICGLDLFSYIGSWGLNLLKSKKIEKIIFVDQGDFQSAISKNLKNNGKNGEFVRSDVFEYLDLQIKDQKKYEVISCDPPAFCKSASKKANALEGYKKLINKILKIISDNGIIYFGSCTQYVSLSELMELFSRESLNFGFKAKLIDIGTQGYDHTNSGLEDRSNYIKFFAYKMELLK